MPDESGKEFKLTEQNNNTENRSLATRDYYEIEEIGLPVEQVVAQVRRVQDVMKAVMRDGEHYGTIPGCEKPSLLKPGAEKLGFTFRLDPDFEITQRDYSGGHREYEVICRLFAISSGKRIGAGVGSCSTMEAKFRYRTENTGKKVPAEYWTTRDPKLIGGPGFSTRKKDGEWLIFHRVEHDNPADYYNTVLKMAKKRAHVDAILTATAASDIFTQDVEELVDNGVVVPEETPKKQAAPTVKPPQARKSEPQPTNGSHGFVEHDSVITGAITLVTYPEGTKPGYITVDGKKRSTFDKGILDVAEIMRIKGIESDVYLKNSTSKKDGKTYENVVLVEAHVVQDLEPKKEPQGTPEQARLEGSPF